ncbi:Uncharacterised protein [Rodentibacter pneumotropicus]|uniref:Uncharacterized protein n=1 Tax=Rodentibacter pneumotropicus TaxID=758 RepID=A0A3S4W1E2_9PAST|nr:Uncharacterised protein [Rodentibacter pneumotropicus]
MSKTTKIMTALCLMGIGALALWGMQTIMHKPAQQHFVWAVIP